jgi:hypothetical protein
MDDLDKLVAPEIVMQNSIAINSVRSLMTIVAGIAAGVLGLTSLLGFGFYLVVHLATSAALVVKMKGDVAECVPGQTIPAFLIDGLSGQLMSFLLFWTVAYAMVNIY